MQRWISLAIVGVSLCTIDGGCALAQSVEVRISHRPNAEPSSSQTIEAGKTVENVAIREGDLYLAGHVTHDVLAVDSHVIIRPGATVGGSVVAVGGSVDIAPGSKVKVIRMDEGLASALDQGDEDESEAAHAAPEPHAPAAAPATHAAPAPASPAARSGSWFVGQVSLLLFGLAAGLALLIVAPQATRSAAAAVAFNPARCLAVGGVAGVGLLFIALFNVGLLDVLKMIWAPFGFAIALLSGALLLSGWVCGLRFVGDALARRFGRPESRIHPYAAAGLGLAALIGLSCALGVVNWRLVPFGLAAQLLVAFLGLGAVCITGFGSDPDWLTKQLQSGSRRLGGPRRRW
jgi:hypothetical protein